jgi:hypothetical protein
MIKKNKACKNNHENRIDVLRTTAVMRIPVVAKGWALRERFFPPKRPDGPLRILKWVPGALLQRVNRKERKADHSPPFENLGL